MRICPNCNTVVSQLDIIALQKVNSIMSQYKEYVLNDFFNSPRIVIILKSLGISSDFLRTSYASDIYDFFYSFTQEKVEFSFCPSVSDFFKEIVNFEDSSQVIFLMYTQFKNSLLSLFLYEDIVKSLSEVEKISAYNSFSILLDFNLSVVLQEYANLLLKKEKDMSEHSRLLEEQTIFSKTDTNGIITFVSDSFAELCGYSKDELIGHSHNIVRSKAFNPVTFERMWQRITMGRTWKGNLKNIRKDGKEVIFETTIMPEYNDQNEIIGYIALRNDITYKVKGQKDSLTGLLNRDAFNQFLNKSIDNFLSSQSSFSLVFIDIDKFKDVNDTHGHVIGDHVLQQFVSIINQHIRSVDIFARWGGEEFILILKDVDLKTSLNRAEKIRKAVAESYFEDVGTVTSSFGVIEYSISYQNTDDLITDVDKCLYNSKNNGRNCISFIEDNKIQILKTNFSKILTEDEVTILLELVASSEYNDSEPSALKGIQY